GPSRSAGRRPTTARRPWPGDAAGSTRWSTGAAGNTGHKPRYTPGVPVAPPRLSAVVVTLVRAPASGGGRARGDLQGGPGRETLSRTRSRHEAVGRDPAPPG